MTLASGADVSIDGVEYWLDHTNGPGIAHRYESLFAQATAIAGETAKQQLRPEKMLWSWTDWSGGEGYPIYHPEDPTGYDIGSLVNVTNPGLLTTRPRRYRTAVARSGSNATTGARPAVGTTWDKAIIQWSDNGVFSRDAIGWTAAAGTTNTASYHYFDADSDGRYMISGVLVEGATTDIVPAVDGVTPAYGDLFTGTTLIDPPFVTEIINGNWYAWGIDSAASGVLALIKGAALSTTSIGTLIYNSGIVPSGTWGGAYWTDMEAAETALYMSFGTPAGSLIFESVADVAAPFWTGPPGFVIKKLIYQQGVLFCVGARVSAGKMFATIYAIPLATRSPIFIAAPRRHRNTELAGWETASAGPESKVFFADSRSGKIFVYDMAREGLSLLDDLANGGAGDGVSFTPYTNMLSLTTSTFENVATGNNLALAGWTQESGAANELVSATNPRNGDRCMSLAAVGNDNTFVMITPTGVKGVAVSASTAYTAYGYVRNNGGTNTITLGIRWYDSTGAAISTSTGSGVVTSTTYQQVSATATSPSNAVYAALALTNAAAQNVTIYADDFTLHPGASSLSVQDVIASMTVHGSRLVVVTYQPFGVGTSLQVITYEDLVKENRDASQAVSATVESGEWDFGVPQEQKALVGFYVNYEVTDSATSSGLLANTRITVSYATDSAISASPTYTALTTITSATAVTQKGRHFIAVSDATTTAKFTRLKMKITLDNNSTAVAPPIVYSVVAEAQLLAYAETWEMAVRVQDETGNIRPRSRQSSASVLRDNLLSLATNKDIVTFLDGSRYEKSLGTAYTTHTVTVEDPTDLVGLNAEGTMRLKLRSVPV